MSLHTQLTRGLLALPVAALLIAGASRPGRRCAFDAVAQPPTAAAAEVRPGVAPVPSISTRCCRARCTSCSA